MIAGLLKGNSTNTRLILLLFFTVAYPCLSQTTGCKNNWPPDKAMAERQLASYREAMKQRNFRAAVPGIRWFLQNAPNWNTKLYVDGTEVYNKLSAAEKDPSKKQVLIDSLMWLYDEQVKRCGDAVNVLNRKATHAAIYNAQNKDRTAEVLSLFDKVLDISGVDVSDKILDSYFRIVYSNFELLGNMNDDDVLVKYKKIQAAIDKKIAWYQGKNRASEVARLKVSKAHVDELLPLMMSAEKATGVARGAVDLATTPAEKAEALIALGTIQARKDPTAARESFRQAMAIDPSNHQPLEKIGDLYASSGDCKKNDNPAKDRLMYIAAYEMYFKAGNNQKMASMKKLFPSKEELLGMNWNAGENKPVGCWIGDTITLKTRD
jgi:tetratricopeptide (TPR) repeat protein